MSKSIFVLLFSFLLSLSGFTQGCFNIGFEDSSFVNWEGDTGTWDFVGPNNEEQPNLTPGIGGLRHRIMHRLDTFDMWSDSTIVPVAPGSNYSVQLGYGINNGGARMQQMNYTFTVSADSSLLIYAVAMVLNDGGHNDYEQPRFIVSLLDTDGIVLDSACGQVDYFADTAISGFQTSSMSNGGNAVLYRDWEFAGIDLLPYVGQEVTLRFKSRSCPYSAHFGYSYVDANCAPREIQVEYCLGQSDSITFTAPLGFDYLWSNGDTNRSFTVLADSADTLYICTLTSTLTGCSFDLEARTEATFYSNFDVLETSCGEATLKTTVTINKGNIANYYWNFGDSTTLGDTSNLAQPTYTYPGPGRYPVMLIVDDGLGCSSDTLIDTANIYFPPVANFTADTVCFRDSTSFANLSTFSPNVGTFFEWDFGDGGSDTAFAPKYLYGSDSLKTVQLIVWSDSIQCGDTISKVIEVFPRPDVGFFKVEPDSCTPHEVNLVNTSTADTNYPIASYLWSFGNLDSSTVRNPTYLYDNPGLYTLYLKVTDINGCADSSILLDYIQVYPIPTADFTVDDSSVYIDDAEVLFENQSNNADSYQWIFGGKANSNAGTSSEINPSWIFKRSGTYSVKLTAISDVGCFDTTYRTISVIDDRTFVPNVITPNGDGANDAFVLKVDLNSISNFQCTIFNRWGAEVYRSQSPGFSWDGTVNGEALPSGIYYYEIEYVGFEDNEFSIRGNVQVLR